MAVTLGEALESARAKGMIDFGEGAIAVASDADRLAKSRKGPDAETPGQVVSGGDTVPLVQEVHASRWEYATMTRDAPSPAAYCHLVVDNGGRPAGSGGVGRSPYARPPRGGSGSNSLKLVHCASSS